MPGLRLDGLDIDTVFALFDTYLDGPADHPVGVAVSGGGDSVALLHMLHAWGMRPLEVLCVDHGINPLSVDWTQSVQAHAERIGAGFTALHWTGAKPKTGLSAAARRARHALLADAAREKSIRVICLAHTQDDIAEAAIMAEEGSSVGAPVMWAPSPAWPQGLGVHLFRPLLGQSRKGLRDFLVERSLSWIDDPANDDMASARARARRQVSQTPLAPVVAAAPARIDPSSLLRDADTLGALGMIVLDAAGFGALPQALARRCLSAAVVSAGGGDALPSSDSIDRLIHELQHETAHTLCGARVQRVAGRIEIVREAGEFARHGLPPLPVAAGIETVWDGRFAVRSDYSFMVQPSIETRSGLSEKDQARLKSLPAALRTVLPVADIDGDKALLSGPHGTEFACWVLPRFLAASGVFARESDLCEASQKPL